MPSNVESKIRWAAVLVFLGLACVLLSFSKIHPLAFIVFLGVACPLTVAGIALFLIALLQRDMAASSGEQRPVR